MLSSIFGSLSVPKNPPALAVWSFRIMFLSLTIFNTNLVQINADQIIRILVNEQALVTDVAPTP